MQDKLAYSNVEPNSSTPTTIDEVKIAVDPVNKPKVICRKGYKVTAGGLETIQVLKEIHICISNDMRNPEVSLRFLMALMKEDP